jgi:hypothetical protein
MSCPWIGRCAPCCPPAPNPCSTGNYSRPTLAPGRPPWSFAARIPRGVGQPGPTRDRLDLRSPQELPRASGPPHAKVEDLGARTVVDNRCATLPRAGPGVLIGEARSATKSHEEAKYGQPHDRSDCCDENQHRSAGVSLKFRDANGNNGSTPRGGILAVRLRSQCFSGRSARSHAATALSAPRPSARSPPRTRLSRRASSRR